MGRGRAVKGHTGYKNTPRRKPVARRSDQRRAASGRCARTASPPTPPQPLSDRRTTLRTTPRGRRPRHTSNRSSPKQSARSATQAPRRTTTRIFCDVTASGSGHCPGCPGRDRTLSRLGPAGTGWGCRARDCVPGQRNTAGTLTVPVHEVQGAHIRGGRRWTFFGSSLAPPRSGRVSPGARAQTRRPGRARAGRLGKVRRYFNSTANVCHRALHAELTCKLLEDALSEGPTRRLRGSMARPCDVQLPRGRGRRCAATGRSAGPWH